jgi:radical SAM protein with 4Fe4S-binding SPASM domain
MSKQQKFDTGKHFCVLPWIHMHVWANGNTYPCCLSTYEYKVGNTNEKSFKELWNSEKMCDMRKNMLDDKPTEGCKKCYDIEENNGVSMRMNTNKSFSHHIERKELTNRDGSVDDVFMSYMDIRFSNICNFKCRSCGPEFSSLWYDDAIAQGRWSSKESKIFRVKDTITELWDDMNQWIDTVEQIYFAGGEPLIMDEHYKILEHLIEIGRTDINISYNTNLSKLKYKSKDVIELWKKFEHITVGASLDDSGERAEVMRSGTIWKDIISNRKRIIEEVPHVKFRLTPTVSVFNVQHCIDFFDEWIYNNLVDPSMISINILTHPDFLSAQILPKHIRELTQNKIREFLKRHNMKNNDNYSDFNSLLTFLNEDKQDLLPKYMKYNDVLDKLRNETIISTFPELGCLYE